MSSLSATRSCAFGLTCRLTTLRLVGVTIMASFMEDLGKHCPTLDELHAERCRMHMPVVTLAYTRASNQETRTVRTYVPGVYAGVKHAYTYVRSALIDRCLDDVRIY